jgi:phosphatidate cytidylyltransferase
VNPLGAGLKNRLLSAIILGPLALGIIFYGHWPFMIMVCVLLIISALEWKHLVENASAPILHFLLGSLYLLIGFCSFVGLRFAFEDGAFLSLAVILCIWASDSGAYAAGKTIGGPKLIPKISPNKTWAGLGGAVFCAGAALAAFLYLGQTYMNVGPFDLLFFAGLGFICGGVAQIGDLLMSFYKRRAGAKDTGHLIPGHGGLLDRIDSALLVIPLFFGLAFLWKM